MSSNPVRQSSSREKIKDPRGFLELRPGTEFVANLSPAQNPASQCTMQHISRLILPLESHGFLLGSSH